MFPSQLMCTVIFFVVVVVAVVPKIWWSFYTVSYFCLNVKSLSQREVRDTVQIAASGPAAVRDRSEFQSPSARSFSALPSRSPAASLWCGNEWGHGTGWWTTTLSSSLELLHSSTSLANSWCSFNIHRVGILTCRKSWSRICRVGVFCCFLFCFFNKEKKKEVEAKCHVKQ